jgi:glycerophosphoryl diester phosphodiesterase
VKCHPNLLPAGIGCPHCSPRRAERRPDYTDGPSSGTMPEPKIDRQIRPAIVAHRGASATHPENTLPAFEAAVTSGADLVELDVRLTRDGVPIVLHDADVSRRTGATGLCHELTLREIKRLDASGGEGGERLEIPTLGEALELLSGRVGVDVEIKNIPGEPAFDGPVESVAVATVRLLEDVAYRGSVLLSSFNWGSIERVKELDPSLLTGFLSTAMLDARSALTYVRSKGHDYVLPQVSAVLEAGAPFVEEAHAAEIGVGTWTVDDPEAIARLFGMGVDAVATNDPAAAAPVRDRFRDAYRE